MTTPKPNRGSGARRALSILQTLLQGPTTRAALYAQLGVSASTLKHDLAAIHDSGIPIYRGRTRVYLEPLAIRNLAHSPVIRGYLERRLPELLSPLDAESPTLEGQ